VSAATFSIVIARPWCSSRVVRAAPAWGAISQALLNRYKSLAARDAVFAIADYVTPYVGALVLYASCVRPGFPSCIIALSRLPFQHHNHRPILPFFKPLDKLEHYFYNNMSTEFFLKGHDHQIFIKSFPYKPFFISRFSPPEKHLAL
jgi:hypothetical protein